MQLLFGGGDYSRQRLIVIYAQASSLVDTALERRCPFSSHSLVVTIRISQRLGWCPLTLCLHQSFEKLDNLAWLYRFTHVLINAFSFTHVVY